MSSHSAPVSDLPESTQSFWGWPLLRLILGALAFFNRVDGRRHHPMITTLARFLFFIDASALVSSAVAVPPHARGRLESFRTLLRASDSLWRRGGIAALARIARDPRAAIRKLARRLERMIRRMLQDAPPTPDAPRFERLDFARMTLDVLRTHAAIRAPP